MTQTSGKQLRAIVGGADGWCNAYCPEINVYGSGETPSLALDSLLVAINMTSRYLMETREMAEDPRRPHAQRVLQCHNALAALKPLFELTVSDAMSSLERDDAYHWAGSFYTPLRPETRVVVIEGDNGYLGSIIGRGRVHFAKAEYSGGSYVITTAGDPTQEVPDALVPPGMIREVDENNPQILLDDGRALWGIQCRWAKLVQ